MSRYLKDAASMPRYDLPEAASYVHMKPATLGSWVRGDAPVIHRPVDGDPRLSYENLIEAFVLHLLRTRMRVPMADIRAGLATARETFRIDRLLLSPRLRARHGNLLVKSLERYFNVGRGGQGEIPEAVEQYLQRIEYQDGFPVGLYPVTRPDQADGPKRVVIRPSVGFGKPVTRKHHIPAAIIASRFRAGETVTELAEDYDLSTEDVEEALRAEHGALAA